MRRTLPLAITFIVGVMVIINSAIIAPGFNKFINDYIIRAVTVSTAWAVALGAFNLMRVHGNRVSRKREGWINSVVLIASFWLLMILGVVLQKGQNDPLYLFFYNNMNVPLNATMFSVLCFYIASAAYRAFRVRNVEATVLLVSAVIVMLGSVPIGKIIFDGFGANGMLGIPWMKNWIMDQANTSVVRGLTLGITLGSLAQAMRNLLGIERGYMSGE
ncbi:MAG: hypothetical protein ACM3ZQ_05650 [Bacillota bacterium]